MSSFVELNNSELYEIDGGWDWGLILGGAALVIATIGVAASAPVSLPILASGALCASSALGGSAIGYGITH